MAKHVLLPLLLVIAFVGFGTYEVLGLGTPAPQVSFESEPAGAVVSVDGEARGVTPLVLRLEPGSYAVQMALGGYKTWTGTVPVVLGAPAPIVAHARLVALTGTVTVVVDPQVPGVRLFVDGAEVAATPAAGRFSLRLSPGKHDIGARAAGYSSAFQEVTVDPNRPTTVTLSLQAISVTVTKVCYGPSGWEYPFGATGNPSTLDWTYVWNFGDGESASGRRPTHVFAREGDYEVIVEGTTPEGDTAQAKTHGHISNDFRVNDSADASPGYCDIRMAGFAILPAKSASPTGYDVLCRFEVASTPPEAPEGTLYYRIAFDHKYLLCIGRWYGQDSWSAGWFEYRDGSWEPYGDGTVDVSPPKSPTITVRLPLPWNLTAGSTGLQWLAQAWASLGDPQEAEALRDETPEMTWERH